LLDRGQPSRSLSLSLVAVAFCHLASGVAGQHCACSASLAAAAAAAAAGAAVRLVASAPTFNLVSRDDESQVYIHTNDKHLTNCRRSSY